MPARDERSHLLTKHNTGYESVIITNETTNDITRSTIFCTHGNIPNNCCEGVNNIEASDKSCRRLKLSQAQHCHSNDRQVSVDRQARNRLIFVSLLCVAFMIGEVVGGFLSNSLAIATDAAHLLTDFVSFMISLFALWIGSRPATRQMSFGWYRAEVIGALVSVLLIWLVTAILVYLAVQRLIFGDFEIEAEIMVITALIGVLVNLIMGVALQIGGVPHGHGHSHGGPSHHHDDHHESGNDDIDHRGKKNINVRAAFIHVVGDFFQSLGVFVAAVVIYFKPQWTFIDPICTFLFSVLVLLTTFNIIKDALNVLMEGIPKGIDFLEVQRTLFETPGVVKVHNLRIWSLSLDKIALAAHLAIAKDVNPTTVLTSASHAIKTRFDIFELTIQVEEYSDGMNDCDKCQDPVS